MKMSIRSATIVLISMLIAAAAVPTAAGPTDMEFLPPKVDVDRRVCTPSQRDDDMVAFWTAWDGKALPKREAYLIQRDLNRLRDLNAAKYEGIIDKMITLLPKIKGNYSQTDALFDRTRTMLAMGRALDVRKQGLVNKLLAIEDHPSGALNSLANYLMEGKGIDADRPRGLKLKVAAAYAGNPDAILDLANLNLGGETIADWDVEPKIAVAMAFGSLVGTLNNGICDRASRIAREFEDGIVVKKNAALAVAWYQFAADLGDTNASWKVAEYHLASEDIRKENDLLIKYLTKAADGGNVSAMLELGKAYLDGSIVTADSDRALHYYQNAALAGSQAGMIRRAQLLETYRLRSPAENSAFEASLRELVKRNISTSWAYTKLARVIIEKKGIWAASEETRPLLEKAATLREGEGNQMLADLLIRESRSKKAFVRASDLLIQSVNSYGRNDALLDLRRLYLCLSPGLPDYEAAEHWSSVEIGAGNKSLVMKPEELARLKDLKDPQTIAALQTQALDGRPRVLALYKAYLEESGHDTEILNFWNDYAEKIVGTDAASAVLEFKRRLAQGDLSRARTSIASSKVVLSPDSGIRFARFLLENYGTDPNSARLAREILEPLAEKGIGRAVNLLQGIAGDNQVSQGGLNKYEKVMRERGDMTSQLLLADAATDPATKDLYYRRAIGAQRCDYDDNISLAEFALRSNRVGDAERWLTTALHMAEGDFWRQVKIGDLYLSIGSPATNAKALELYQQARRAGEKSAYFRLVTYYSNSSSRFYDPAEAATIFIELVGRSDVKQVPDQLLMLEKLKPEIHRLVGTRLNIRELFERSAEAGQPVAMRELAKILRRNANDRPAVTAAADWLKKAAEAGDSEAMLLLSETYAYGTGLEASSEKAHYWMAEAAKKGNQDAVRIYSLMSN
jgi:TPR repeat protein